MTVLSCFHDLSWAPVDARGRAATLRLVAEDSTLLRARLTVTPRAWADSTARLPQGVTLTRPPGGLRGGIDFVSPALWTDPRTDDDAVIAELTGDTHALRLDLDAAATPADVDAQIETLEACLADTILRLDAQRDAHPLLALLATAGSGAGTPCAGQAMPAWAGDGLTRFPAARKAARADGLHEITMRRRDQDRERAVERLPEGTLLVNATPIIGGLVMLGGPPGPLDQRTLAHLDSSGHPGRAGPVEVRTLRAATRERLDRHAPRCSRHLTLRALDDGARARNLSTALDD